jgi:hypothetical protein
VQVTPLWWGATQRPNRTIPSGQVRSPDVNWWSIVGTIAGALITAWAGLTQRPMARRLKSHADLLAVLPNTQKPKMEALLEKELDQYVLWEQARLNRFSLRRLSKRMTALALLCLATAAWNVEIFANEVGSLPLRIFAFAMGILSAISCAWLIGTGSLIKAQPGPVT